MKICSICWITLMIIFVPLYLSAGSKKPTDKTIKELLAAQDTVTIEKTRVALETYLWRDFMPVSPPDGKPMRAVVSLVPVQSDKIPAHVDLVKLWVISQENVWSTGLETVGEPDLAEAQTKIEKTAADGPKWGPGVTVTVLVQIRDPEGNYHLIKADDQMIHRTE